MMYDEKHPDAEPGIQSEPHIVKSVQPSQVRPCKVCGDETRWFHRVFIKHVCSEECTRALERLN